MRVRDCRTANATTGRLRGDAGHGPGAGNAEDYSWRVTRTLAGNSELIEALATEATTRTQSRHGSGHKGEDRLGCLEIKLYCWTIVFTLVCIK